MTSELSGISLPSVMSAAAPTRQLRPTLAVEDGGGHADEGVVADGAAVEHGAVADGAVGANDEWEAGIGVEHGVI